MDDNLLAPYGLYCGTCEFLNREEKPNCSGCDNQEEHPFCGECKLYACTKGRKTEHYGLCEDFPCELSVNQFDPALGFNKTFPQEFYDGSV
jgi:hypothetical protein